VDVYQLGATPGALVNLGVVASDASQPPKPDMLFPVMEVLDGTGTRYQLCSVVQNYSGSSYPPYTNPCVNGLGGYFYSQVYYAFQVPGSGTDPVVFYLRISDARGDARPDFIYTLSVSGVD
jgi:hypothetical protein